MNKLLPQISTTYLYTLKIDHLFAFQGKQKKWVIQNANEWSAKTKGQLSAHTATATPEALFRIRRRGFERRCQSASRPQRSRNAGVLCVFLPPFSCRYCCLFLFSKGRYLYSNADAPGDDSTERKCIPRGPPGDVRGPEGGLVRPQAERQLLQSFTYRQTMRVCVCVCVCFNNLGLFADAQSDSSVFFGLKTTRRPLTRASKEDHYLSWRSTREEGREAVCRLYKPGEFYLDVK